MRTRVPCPLRAQAGGKLIMLLGQLRAWFRVAYPPYDQAIRAVFVEQVPRLPWCGHTYHVVLHLDPAAALLRHHQRHLSAAWVAAGCGEETLRLLVSQPSDDDRRWFTLAAGYDLDMPRFVLVPRCRPRPPGETP